VELKAETTEKIIAELNAVKSVDIVAVIELQEKIKISKEQAEKIKKWENTLNMLSVDSEKDNKEAINYILGVLKNG